MNMPAKNQVSISYASLMKSRVLVLTGAGASAPLGIPTMDRFSDLLPDTGALEQIRPPAGRAKWDDLEELLGRLTLYERIHNDHRTDGNLHRWFRLDPSNNVGQKALKLKADIFEAIVTKLGFVEGQAADKAIEIYEPLLQSFLPAAANDPPVLPVFTTNYDLAFEAIRDGRSGFTICNGIDGAGEARSWSTRNYESKHEYRFAVFRLHGCSHWMKHLSSGRIFYQQMPDTRNPETREPCVLYPIPGKEDRIFEQPFRWAYWHLRLCSASPTK